MLALATVAACGAAPARVDAGPAVVELGTGDLEFVPLGDGADLLVIQGPQGGFHVLGSVRTSGLAPGDPERLGDPTNPVTEFRLFSGAERVDLGAAVYRQGLDPIAGAGHQMLGRLVVLDIRDDVELTGAELHFEVAVTDHRGASATDRRRVIGAPHPSNP